MAMEAAADLVLRTETRRQELSASIDLRQRGKLGQFFTPSPVADFIASLARLPDTDTIRILDPGAGIGSLTASLVARLLEEGLETKINITACEVDSLLHPTLQNTLDDCVNTARLFGVYVEANLVCSEFISWAVEENSIFGKPPTPFDIVIMNPPYKKLAANSRERKLVSAICTETSNLYSAFLSLGIHLLNPGGQLLAITPRSFANGPYFRPFRQYFLERMHISRIHVFESRNKVFADLNVLQENVIVAATRVSTVERGPVVVSASRSCPDEIHQRSVPYTEMVHPGDAESFIYISADEEGSELAASHEKLPCTLRDLNFHVSTGRVVDFRSKKHLRPDHITGAVPLIYPLHMCEGIVRWPVPGAKKNNAIMLNEDTEKLTFPSGWYVVVKRLSSKEEKRRVVAVVFDPEKVRCKRIGFENHVNVFHHNGDGLPADIARGLCLWLNSTILDRFVRRFSGHTQINATDLRNLRYPSAEQLSAIGRAWVSNSWPKQIEIDDLIRQNVTIDMEV